MSTQPDSPTPAAQQSGQLNVVLHGLLGIVVWDRCIEVVVPQMDEHVFLAGAWRRERRLKQSASYQLRGVRMQSLRPVGLFSSNATLQRFTVVDRSPERLFCSIYLPFPDSVHSGRLSRRSEDLHFAGRDAERVTNDQFAMLNVLCYSFDDLAALTLGPALIWEPLLKNNRVSNLHIFGEEESPFFSGQIQAGSTHPERGFQNLVALFPGMDLRFSGSGKVEQSQFLTEVPGLPDFEQLSLFERSTFDPETDPDFPSSPGPGRPGNCFSIVVDNETD